METVTDKDQGSGDRLRLYPASADDGVAAKHQRFPAAVDQQSHGRPVRNDAGHVEFHGLIVTVHTGWLESQGVKLRDDVSGGAKVALGAGETALHAVVGECLDLRPPGLTFRLIRGCDLTALSEQMRREVAQHTN